MSEKQLYGEIYHYKEQLSQATTRFWNQYSGPDTWYFWFNLAAFLLPLLYLYFKVDKRRLFEISFYGYTAHVLWSNADYILSSYNLLAHPHSLLQAVPGGISVTAVIFPVTFMLLYQYCTNKSKNFYLYGIGASIIFAYGFGYISKVLGLLKMHNGMNLTFLFLIDIAVAFISLWATRLFLKIKSKSQGE
jgi:hypothetical protein